ncbi:MAG: transketolase family protein [Saccharofermentans sp.]|jgi:transketolase|nr:transketolase family protein [Mageeibacillus sp.]MCI1263797.1 transketolase family protein [Saccharofermentans sp.]MCI1275047.1 transketolase family protein [Saccharofermentans sp.]MCI1769161.1 transketolase family protein [Mageeibacillus sp.]MCI2044706.1 transketolase family protein [Mageeibacillus sp.]
MNCDIKIATRDSYGNALAELGDELPQLVVLDCDLAGATKTSVFKRKFPSRHIDCGIAEADMTGIGAGLATCGKIPFISSFAMFVAGRNYEQVRNSIAYPHLNVKIGATHAGITVGEDGATHQCIEDLALMRVIPGMTVVVPCDDIEARAAVRAAALTDGPFYLRFGRSPVPIVNDDPGYKFELGKAVVLRQGADTTIFVNGVCVSEALLAADMLSKEGIEVCVVNVHTLKPIDSDTVLDCSKGKKRVFTCEEHSVIGGLGSAVCDVLSEHMPTPVSKIGINDVFGQSGTASGLMAEYGLDYKGIARAIREKLG